MFVKICGLSTPESVRVAVESGANALGFVFATSPRQVTPEKARELCRDVPADVIRVAVTLHPTTDEWTEVRQVFEPDWLQTDAEDLDTLELEGCEPLPVYRAAKSDGEPWPTRILFEGVTSGSGAIANWQDASRVAEETNLVLAGGLDVDNVAAAIGAVKPWGVDVSSGVERERGLKDAEKIREFIARVRATEHGS